MCTRESRPSFVSSVAFILTQYNREACSPFFFVREFSNVTLGLVFVVIHFGILVFRFLPLCNIFEDNEHKSVQTRAFQVPFEIQSVWIQRSKRRCKVNTCEVLDPISVNWLPRSRWRTNERLITRQSMCFRSKFVVTIRATAWPTVCTYLRFKGSLSNTFARKRERERERERYLRTWVSGTCASEWVDDRGGGRCALINVARTRSWFRLSSVGF